MCVWSRPQVLFLTFVVLALVGRATKQRTMWKVAYPAPSVCAMALVLCFWCRPGVRCAKYGAGVLLGLVWTLLSDVFIVEEPELQLFYLAFLCSMVGVFCFTYSFWAPSVPTSRLADANVDTSRSASAYPPRVAHTLATRRESWPSCAVDPARGGRVGDAWLALAGTLLLSHRCAMSLPLLLRRHDPGAASSAGVPLQPFRLVPILALAGAVVAAWRTIGWKDTPLVIPVGVYLGALGCVPVQPPTRCWGTGRARVGHMCTSRPTHAPDLARARAPVSTGS